MNLRDFKGILGTFTDDRADLDIEKGQLIVQIREELIEATVTEERGDVYVEDGPAKTRAFDWLINRVAKLPQLADRIIGHVAREPHFVTPAGKVLDHIDAQRDNERPVHDVPTEIVTLISNRPAGTTNVLYVTSDAGEGKTTVIDQIAHDQANRYKRGEAEWLLLPLRLGGRSFLTFDDVVVAELVNRFRFQFFYYDAFLELVRLGVLVPAFDGFEEIFVEGSTGEAVSSLGNLVRTLNSSGGVVITVRKAHFEYHSFRDQARIFDALSDVDASFARISLDRWDRDRFLEYCSRRGLSNAGNTYAAVRDKLQSSDHPVLTRAVLAKRLVDVAEKNDLSVLLERLGTDVGDYFYHFVNAIVEREVQEKWIDRSGVPHQALLTVDEHHRLLSMIAKEMWITSSDSLGAEYLELVTELFAEELSKTAPIARQIANRLTQHSLIAVNRTTPLSYSFDHDDFRMFYWGEAIGTMLVDTEDPSEVAIYLGKRPLPEVAADAAVVAIGRVGVDMHSVLSVLRRVASGSSAVSQLAENVAALTVRVLDLLEDAKGVTLRRLHFSLDSIRGRKIGGVIFDGCSFSQVSFDGASLKEVKFSHCTFDEIDLDGLADLVDVELHECSINSVRRVGVSSYDPAVILQILRERGFVATKQDDSEQGKQDDSEVGGGVDELTELAMRALRSFLRATALNETTLERRLGVVSSRFFEEVLPLMIDKGVVKEVDFAGGGRPQRRFRLTVSMQSIEGALSGGRESSLTEFLETVVTGRK